MWSDLMKWLEWPHSVAGQRLLVALAGVGIFTLLVLVKVIILLQPSIPLKPLNG